MKIFTLSLAVALCCGLGSEAAQLRKAPTRPDTKTMLATLRTSVRVMTPAEDVSDEPIYDVPDGEERLLSRDCDSFEVWGYEAVHSEVLGSIIKLVTTEENVYIGYPVSGYPVEAFIKATETGDTLSIAGAQPVYEDYDWDNDEYFMVYVVPMDIIVDENQQGTCVPASDMRYDLVRNADGVYESIDHDKMLGVCLLRDISDENGTITATYSWTGYGDRDVRLSEVSSRLVEIPEGAHIQKWVWQDQYETAVANVVVDGNDIYLSGMDRNLPDSWVKGTREADQVTFPSGQFLGPDFSIGYFSYFCGAEFEYITDPETGEDEPYCSLVDSAIFDYNDEGPALYTVNGYVVNSTADRLYPLYAYDQVDLHYNNRDVNAAPASPYNLVYEENPDWDERKVWVQIPNVDVDGNLLDVTQLYYQIFVNGEPVVFDPEVYSDFTEATTLIPYNLNGYDIYVAGTDHTVYLYCEVDGTLGVRSVYINEEGETLYSDMTTTDASGIRDMSLSKTVTGEVWHDLYGRRLTHPAAGTIAIRTLTYSDGSVSHRKVVTK